MIGTKLSHYQLLEEIGSGGMGVVYRARDERLERDVAVKVLPAGALDETARARFRREALALSRLSHPHIGTIHDFGNDGGTDFLVMELVRGRTLRDRLREGPMPVEEVAEIGIAVAEALEEAHEQGVVHRDLKPENVLVTTKGWVKVLDFGLAALRSSSSATVTTETLTTANTLTGTLPYMAPEQLLGAKADARTDLYAAGVLLYELATGTRPFDAGVQAALIGEILHKREPAPSSRRPGIPLWFNAAVSRCLEKEQSARFENAAALRGALKQGLREGFGAIGATLPTPAGTALGAPTPVSSAPTDVAGRSVIPEAYEAVLRGRQIISRRTEETMRRGIEHFRRAIELDPLYPAAHAGLAVTFDLMGFWAMAAPVDCFPRARVSAERALELDPRWAPAHAALAYTRLYYDWDFARAEEGFRRCMALDPNYAIGPLWIANLLIVQGRAEEAVDAVRRAQALDPVSSIATLSSGWLAHFTRRDYAFALREYQKAIDFDPEFHVSHWQAAWSYGLLGRIDDAVASVTRAIEVSKGLLICYPTLAWVHALAGRADVARRTLTDLEAKAPARYVMPVEVAAAYEALGERDTALGWLERGLKERSHWMIFLGIDPRFDGMREDPRFVAVASRVLAS